MIRLGLLAIALLLPGPLAAAEGEACIKYHKCIPLAQFKCTDAKQLR
jgi:hypothetical protein